MQRVPYQHSREKTSAARKHSKSNSIILMPEFHILSKSPGTSVASPRTEGWGSRWWALPAEAQHYSQPARGSQPEDETTLHVWVTADGGSSLVQQSNRSCWAVCTSSQHLPSSNSPQDGARLWEGLTGERGCSARTRHRRDNTARGEVEGR